MVHTEHEELWLLHKGAKAMTVDKMCVGREGHSELREIARSEWVILPVQEVAAYTWCTECEHFRSGTCPEARQAKWAHVGWSPWYRCASKVDNPCTGCPDSISDSGPEHWEWAIGKAGGYCRSVLEPPLSPQPTVPLQPRFPLQELASQPRWFPPWKSPHRMRFFIRAFMSPHAAWNLCSPAAYWLKQRSSNVVGSQAVRSRRSGTEPREEIACAGRPLGTQHG